MYAQNLDKIGKSPLFRLTGGIGVNSVFYNGNANREPFTYFLSGNVNLNISDLYNIPFSFSYSNSKFQTNTPFTFNRLSLHPSYKWVTAHIGDVNMSFSPYTLNGHQFTGLGLDLNPKDKFKISVMYGRLLKSREFDEENLNGGANYRRIGYGFKTSYKLENAKIGAILFRATDDVASLKNAIPIENEILPKENTVISFDGEMNIWKKLKFRGEVALSALTEDVRVGGRSDHFASFLVSDNPTTQYYKAYNLNFAYQVGKGSIGLGYEFIDPNYRTLGGYFFNNDLENITVNAAQTIFKDKVAINVNAGLQRDNLDGSKATQLSRLVMAINVAYNASKKLNVTTGYSSFQSFTNIKDQFDFINGVSPIEEALDQDNFAQISQNANLNVNYKLKESEYNRQNINFSFSFQDAVNKIGDVERSEDNSEFYNTNAVYTIAYPESNLSISGAVNTSFSKLGVEKNIIIGPTLSIAKSFLEKKLKLNSAFGYNQSITNGEKQGDIVNIRIGARYVYQKKHNFNLNGMFQLRNSTNINSRNFTLTFGYNYSFGLFNSKNIRLRNRKTRNKKKLLKKKYAIKFTYKDSLYIGTISEVDTKVKKLLVSPKLSKLPKEIRQSFNKERIEIASEKKSRKYKIKVIKLLDKISIAEENERIYTKLLDKSIEKLTQDVVNLDFTIEKTFVENKKEIIKSPLWGVRPDGRLTFPKTTQEKFNTMNEEYQKSLKKLLVHRWVLKTLEAFNTKRKTKQHVNWINKYKSKYAYETFKMLTMRDKKQKIKLYLQGSVIEFLTKESEKYIDENQYKLKYINQN